MASSDRIVCLSPEETRRLLEEGRRDLLQKAEKLRASIRPKPEDWHFVCR